MVALVATISGSGGRQQGAADRHRAAAVQLAGLEIVGYDGSQNRIHGQK
jgi:hypothetical protein